MQLSLFEVLNNAIGTENASTWSPVDTPVPIFHLVNSSMTIVIQCKCKIIGLLFIVKDIDEFVYFSVYQEPLLGIHTILYADYLITAEWEIYTNQSGEFVQD